jgi:DNA-directed RNA polymerase subunit RPC12/RpoP
VCSENKATKANHFGTTAMIGFSCTNCGYTFSVQDQYEGQRIKCPRCDCVGVVVDDSGRIKIICQNCGNENSVPETSTGQEIKCPKCNNIVVAASVEKEPADKADDGPQEKNPPKPKKSEISERGLIIIISVAAAVIVIGLIIIAAIRSGN